MLRRYLRYSMYFWVILVIVNIIVIFKLSSENQNFALRDSFLIAFVNQGMHGVEEPSPTLLGDSENEGRNKRRLYRLNEMESTRLSQLLVRKFEKGLDLNDPYLFRGLINVGCGGFGNNLRGALSAVALCIFADCVPIISHGIGRNHKGNMLDYFSARDSRLQKYMRYENHDRDESWGSGGRMYRESDGEVFFKKFEDGDSTVATIIDSVNPDILHEADGSRTHFCYDSVVCEFLKEPGNVEYDTLRQRITKEIDTYQIFRGKLKLNSSQTAVVYRNNNFYVPHLLNDETKTRILCDLGLCDEVEKFLFDPNVTKRNEFPVIGYQYLGGRIGGKLFDDLFVLSPRLQPIFRKFVQENVFGFLLGMQVRISWVGATTMHSTVGWDQWIKGARMIITEGEASSENEVTIFVSCDRDIPEEVIEKLYNIDPKRVKKVLTKFDFPFDRCLGDQVNHTFHEGQSLENRMNTEEGVISTVFDFEMLGISDVTIITFVSSFGQFAGWSRSTLPSYTMFSHYQLPPRFRGDGKFMYKTRFSSYWTGGWWDAVKVHLDWLFDLESLYQG